METIYEPFSISTAEIDNWSKRSRRNTFFELVFIAEGEGDQFVNYVKYPYSKDNFFLLPASECHAYNVRSRTKFVFLRFTHNYFNANDAGSIDYSTWFSRLNFIIGRYNRLPGELIKDDTDKRNAIALLNIILEQCSRTDHHSRLITQSNVVALLGIIARNIDNSGPGGVAQDDKIADILNYIHYNLFDEQKINVKFLSSHFNIAESYFSEYFKRKLNQSFQDFILRSKLKIAEARVLYTTQPFKKIALELGFTDSSHLNRMMKKYFNTGMKEIRAQVKVS